MSRKSYKTRIRYTYTAANGVPMGGEVITEDVELPEAMENVRAMRDTLGAADFAATSIMYDDGSGWTDVPDWAFTHMLCRRLRRLAKENEQAAEGENAGV